MVFIYCVAPNKKIAQSLATQMLKEKLCGCVNIIPNMQSMYWWQGKIETTKEVVILFKTTKLKAKNLTKSLEKHHPYKVPCIAEIALAKMNSSYKNWLLDCLKTSSTKNFYSL